MAHEYLRELITSAGLVTGGEFAFIADDDLPRVGTPGNYESVTVDQWGRVTGGIAGSGQLAAYSVWANPTGATVAGQSVAPGDVSGAAPAAVLGFDLNGGPRWVQAVTTNNCGVLFYSQNNTQLQWAEGDGVLQSLGGDVVWDKVILAYGGTGSDLAATGPGLVYQASAGAALSVVPQATVTAGAFTFTGGLSSAGAGALSERFGASAATGSTAAATALGHGATVSGDGGTAVGQGATAGQNGVAVGNGATAADYGTSVGSSITNSTGLVAVGTSVTSVNGSTCVGGALTSTGYYQGLFGRNFTAEAVNFCSFIGSPVDLPSGHAIRAVGGTSTQGRSMFELAGTWATTTDAARKGRFSLGVFDSSSAITPREALRAESDGARAWAGVPAGNSTAFARLGGTLFDHYADAGNSTTTETDLVSDTTPAAALASNGDKLEGEYAGVFVSSATATRQVRAYFAGTLIFDTGTLTLSLSAAWVLYVTLIRVSATVVRYSATLTTEGAALAAYTAVGELTGLTLSGTNVFKVTGQAAGVGAASNDIVAKLGTVAWKPAA